VAAGQQLRTAIVAWFCSLPADERERLGFLRDADLKNPHFHSNRRVTSDGEILSNVIGLTERIGSSPVS